MAYHNQLKNKALALSAGLMLLTAPASSAETTIIYAGELLAVPGSSPSKEKTLIIEDGLITAVRDGFVDAKDFTEGTKVIDLKDSFVMPGLMDMHVHLQTELSPKSDSETLRMSNADIGMHSVLFAKRTLEAGFTTVRDLGSEPNHIYALRDASAKGWIAAPRIIAAGGGISATGGHADVSGMRHDLLEKYTPKTICDGADDCRRAIRHSVKYGADVIKITATGGVLSDTDTGTGQQMTDDELKEVMTTAHSLGRKVAAHAHAAEGINAALRAGVDSIEHGSYSDDESIKLFKKTGAYLVPTLLAGDTVVQMAKDSDFMTAAIKAKALRVGPDMKEHFSIAYKAGVNIAYGTDSGVSKHGNNAQEAIIMNEAGMPAMAVLKSATVNTADLIGMSDVLGTLEAGKYADIIALETSPLIDLHALLNVDFVMKAGVVYKEQ